MNLPITPVYTAFLALLFLILSVRTLLLRKKLQIGVGDGGNAVLKRAARAHGNFSEYVPLALLLMTFSEVWAAPGWLLHGAGGCLCLGRSLHAYGISQPEENLRFRVSGMALTFGSTALSVGFLFFHWLTQTAI